MPAPANDNWADAQVLSGASGSTAWSTVDATSSGTEFWTYSGHTIYYVFTAATDGVLTLTITNDDGVTDSGISAWADLISTPLYPDDSPALDFAYSDGATADPYSLVLPVAAGSAYTLQLDDGGTGTSGTLAWSFAGAAVAPPDPRAPIRRVSPTMSTIGALDAFGRPDPDVYVVASTVEEDWGYLRVYVGLDDTDVTDLRGVPAEIREYGYLEPFGYGPAVVGFPQISPFDALGEGDLDWFVQGFNVTFKREEMDGTLTVIWEGLASTWKPESSESGYVMVVNCAGALQQAQLEPMPPAFDGGLMDVGEAIKTAFDGVPSRRYADFPTVVTTRGTRNRGSWQSVYDYAQEILSTAYNADGTLQWTVGCDPGRIPTLFIKDRATVNCHIALGTPGALLDELSDITAAPNVFYGEGINEDGGRWRNSRYPNSNPPVFVALAGVSDNMPFTYDSEGNPTANPSFDPDRLRVARYENFGSGISKSEGVESALAELTRDVNPGWYGTLTLTVDPEECSRRDIRAGWNIGIRHHHGDPVRLFHVAEVDVDHQANAVKLTVDTNARDWITLAGLRERDREAAADPARRLNPPRRRSRMTPDQRPVFDSENGAGVIPATALTADVWNILPRIPATRYGTISRTEITTASAATRFVVGVFSKPPTASALNTMVHNPLTTDYGWDANADDLSDAGLQMAWGDHFAPEGYYPAEATDDSPTLTGRMVDDQAWDFVSDEPPWLWLAIFPDAACTVTGRLYLAPEA